MDFRNQVKDASIPLLLNNDAVVTLTGNGTVNNPGTVYSEPVITIEGNGDVSLTIGEANHATHD